MPVWSCLPFPLDGCFQKLDIRNLREKLKRNSYFLSYLLTLHLKVCSGHVWSFKLRSNLSFLVFTSEGLFKALQKAVIAWANRFGERDVNNSIGRVIPKVHWASI